MNIFYLDHDPAIAATMMVDRHVVKMILESAQLLSTAHRVLDGQLIDKKWQLFDARENVLYKATHINHPCAKWCRESIANYDWLVEHMFALLVEYTRRYQKTHKVQGELSYMLQSPPLNLKATEPTPVPCAMPIEYINSDDPVTNYRCYYKFGKRHLHQWSKMDPPNWITHITPEIEI